MNVVQNIKLLMRG